MSPTESTADSLDSCWTEAAAEIAASDRRANNVGKLAAWLLASHVEKAPRKRQSTRTN